MLGEVGAGEVLGPGHKVDVDIIDEGLNPLFEAVVGVAYVLVDAKNDYRLDR